MEVNGDRLDRTWNLLSSSLTGYKHIEQSGHIIIGNRVITLILKIQNEHMIKFREWGSNQTYITGFLNNLKRFSSK